ncbi:type II secretion system F family protein [Candidatus Pacearchaeota archaeon]|nr:type II secretion system F family protein [Candidatus Pacearchaeota archaeon]
MSKNFQEIKELSNKLKKTIKELKSINKDEIFAEDPHEKNMFKSQKESLLNSLSEINNNIKNQVWKVSLSTPLENKEKSLEEHNKHKKISISDSPKKDFLIGKKGKRSKIKIPDIERESLKRLQQEKEKEEKKKPVKPSKYAKVSNKLFSKWSVSLFNKKILSSLERDLIKANVRFTPTTYLSMILFTSVLAFLFSFFILAAIAVLDLSLMIKFSWIVLVLPAGVFISMYTYPTLEKKSVENKINQELPFATIHMSAISGAMIEPSKIFGILMSTREYKNLEREFIKIINGINIYGYNLVSALRKTASNTASKKFSELLNGLATTITSGGDLSEFFDKRSESLLFQYRLEREKYSKSAETFMDIYISVVIAAPMILMLLLIMMKISGLGVSLSATSISIIMILAIAGINIGFLTFLQLRQPSE